ncbi:MAG: ORF6N domain-containing protein [Burkholderiales bacterium]
MGSKLALPVERIENRILLVRGHKVLIDADLAALYGVQTRALNQAVKRNAERFPADFMFRLSARELDAWRSQAVISNPGARMGLRRAPFAFTEHGALMAATVLNSPRAVEVSLYVVRAFVRLRRFLATHKDLARRLAEHEKKLASHDQAIAGLVNTIRNLMSPPEPARKRRIGFVHND